MKATRYFLTTLTWIPLTLAPLAANQSGITYHIGGAEVPESEMDEDACQVSREVHPWYYHQHVQTWAEDIESDPTYQLDQDTAWPSQRDAFSDYMMR